MYRRLFLKYANTPLLATDTLVSNAVSLLLSDKTDAPPNALSTKAGENFNSNLIEIRKNVAILNITGPIFRYGKVEACDVVYGTQHFSEALAKMEADVDITDIVLNFDTGGGEATGIGELAEQIRMCNKHTIAYVDGMSASAGYWLASACDKIVAHETAYVGSIGVVFAFLDTTKLQENMGVEQIEIVSTLSPKKRIDPKSDDGRAEIQTLADDLAEIFVSNVAKYRSTTADVVKKEFGQGGLLIASKALEANMIDKISTFEALIEDLLQGDLMQEENNRSGASVSAPANNPITAEAFKSANPEAYAEIFNAGATAERERIQSIAAIDAPHYQSVITEHMFNGTSTVKDVKVALFDAQKEAVEQKQLSFAKGGNEVSKALANISTTHTGDAINTPKATENPLLKHIKGAK